MFTSYLARRSLRRCHFQGSVGSPSALELLSHLPTFQCSPRLSLRFLRERVEWGAGGAVDPQKPSKVCLHELDSPTRELRASPHRYAPSASARCASHARRIQPAPFHEVFPETSIPSAAAAHHTSTDSLQVACQPRPAEVWSQIRATVPDCVCREEGVMKLCTRK